ncbi:MAG: AAA family ATPase [Lachnospiraceae bacterium]|nr:AAA family ATPase [Lachnospiraceae bacterium]
MQIKFLRIKNFKSIREMEINDIENCLILVGKNNTGKTVVLDAIRAIAGNYQVQETDFNEKKQNIQFDVVLEITGEDLRLLHNDKRVSGMKNYQAWYEEFQRKLPCYRQGILAFSCVINQKGTIRYEDGYEKHNPYLLEIFPKIYYIDTARKVKNFQEDFFVWRQSEEVQRLRDNLCIFDTAKQCNQCFQCIGLIKQKKPEELTLQETALLLEYKMYQLNLEEIAEKINRKYRKNGGAQELHFELDCSWNEMLAVKIQARDKKLGHKSPVEQLGNGMRSIYMLSLLETYIEEEKSIPSIIIVEYPELFLHPSLQKTASKILYRLSKKNQVIFTTHSPNMVSNFTRGQVCQVVLDKEGYSIANQKAGIDDILNDLGYSANDLMNVDFVFIVEGKQDKNRFPLLLEKYYRDMRKENGELSRIAIITTNSCTNIKTYANLKYMNQLYLRDQFLMIRDSDGKDPKKLAAQLCRYYSERNQQDIDKLPRVRPENILILKYYSFENYFLNPKVMVQLNLIKNEEHFWRILWSKWKKYLYKIASAKKFQEVIEKKVESIEDIKEHFTEFKIYMRGHNLYDIFYGPYKEQERELLKRYLELAPREDFQDILDHIDGFIYFNSRKK